MKYSKFKLAQEAIKHKGFLQKFPAIFRMLKLWYKGDYKMKVTDILLPAIALVYILSPIDFIPDFVPVVGAFDDLLILAVAIPLLMKEVDKFLTWEEENKNKNKDIVEVDVEIIE